MASTAVFASVALVASPTPATSLEGHWLHPEKSVIIRLSPCGSNLCGTVTWANASAQKAAHRGIDKLVGAELLTGFKPNRNGQWKGNIFIPDLNMPNRFEVLAAMLSARGHSDARIAKILGGNFARVLGEVWG